MHLRFTQAHLSDANSAVIQLSSKVDELSAFVHRVDNLVAASPSSVLPNKSYAAAVKPKHLLTIKSVQENFKAVDKKNEVANILREHAVIDSKFPSNGNIVMNFKDRVSRDNAAEAIIGRVPGTEIRKVGHITPKIMICNVYNVEEEADIEYKREFI